MTRENKVALVVGFALVLLVGLLVSDHLSEARRQQAADLVPPEETAASALAPELIDLQSTASIQVPVAAPAPALLPAAGAPPPEPAVIRMPDLLEMERAAAAAEPAGAQVHLVRPGESLSVIAQRYYGTAKLTRDLAAFNNLGDPDSLRAGQRLKIPDVAVLTGRAKPGEIQPGWIFSGDRSQVEPERSGKSSQAGFPHATYRVRPGDTLSSIAGTLLHAPGRWREIYELNRDVLDDEDTLATGTVIRIPGR